MNTSPLKMRPLVEYIIEAMDPKDNNKVLNTYIERNLKDAQAKYEMLKQFNPALIYNLDIRIICVEPTIHRECLIYNGTPNLPF